MGTRTTTFIHLQLEDQDPYGSARRQDSERGAVEVKLQLGAHEIILFPGTKLTDVQSALHSIIVDLERLSQD